MEKVKKCPKCGSTYISTWKEKKAQFCDDCDWCGRYK